MQAQQLTGTLNGILNEQYQETGISEYTTDLSSFVNDRTLHGLEIGYQHLDNDIYLDLSFSFFYRNEHDRTKEPYALPISRVGRSYTQGAIGKYYKHEQSFFFAGVHMGISSTWLGIDPTYSIHVTLDEDEEEMLIENHTLRTGFRVGAQSGDTQGIRVVWEYGFDILGNQDQKFLLGYFFTL